MEIKRVVLVMADISGYTRFMKAHTATLLHAEVIIADLLEAVLDRTEFPLTLSKLEGDAACLYLTLDADAGQDARAVAQIVIHRLMKNSIPAKEYIVMTEAFYELSGGLAGQTPEGRTEECEGIGPVPIRVYYPIGERPFYYRSAQLRPAILGSARGRFGCWTSADSAQATLR